MEFWNYWRCYLSSLFVLLSVEFVIARRVHTVETVRDLENRQTEDILLRVKRNISDGSINETTPEVVTQTLKDDLIQGKWYGSEDYMKRTLFLDNQNKKPTICYNNVSTDVNETVYGHFICPMTSQPDTWSACCGPSLEEKCCIPSQSKAENKNKKKKKTPKKTEDFDLVTGLSIAAGFASSVTICMTLYCCCCQRRSDVGGMKMMWVRRSFGKDLNKLDGSHGSHLTPGAAGHGNGSRNASPSVSRRNSHETHDTDHHHHHHKKGAKNKKHKDSEHDDMLVPSNVTITLTTPSDEQGPASPLLQNKNSEVQT